MKLTPTDYLSCRASLINMTTNLRRGVRTKYTASEEYLLPGIINMVKSLFRSWNALQIMFFTNHSLRRFLTVLQPAQKQRRVRTLGQDDNCPNMSLPAYKGLLNFFDSKTIRTFMRVQASRHWHKYSKPRTTTRPWLNISPPLDLTPDEVHAKGLSPKWGAFAAKWTPS